MRNYDCTVALGCVHAPNMNGKVWRDDHATKRRNICLASAVMAFTIGLFLGILIPVTYYNRTNTTAVLVDDTTYTPVSFVEDTLLVDDGIFWGSRVESSLPEGFTEHDNHLWNSVVSSSVAVRLESGCGRMQNRLVTFQDGTKGCVRYRQNLDQIQGELFSFYLGQLLKLPNLAPSTIDLIDLNSKRWRNLQNEIATAQWSSNRPVVITKYIDDLDSANIPKEYRPPDIKLSHKDIQGNLPDMHMDKLEELAQWSDLVVFDYLTANLDRVVNNLYNRQWNINIMDSPAHNLAKTRKELLVFLDNESGLLHGYRLLQKYEVYHSLLLNSLCIFRRQTIEQVEYLRRTRNVGGLLMKLFETHTSTKIRDVLPPLPEKSVKILNERLDRVHAQVERCKSEYTLS